jgi:MtN3 and saliva related transmembrane protein
MPFSPADMTEGIGFLAAACTTFSFVPQLIKIRKQGGRDLSYLMLTIYLCGLGLWLVYGVRLHAPAVITANVVAIFLVGAALVLKILEARRRPAKVDPVEPPRENPLGIAPVFPADLDS